MKTMAANAPWVPSTISLVLTFGILVAVATFPTRFRVVVLKPKHSQPQSHEQPDEPDKRGDHTETLFPHSRSNGAEDADKELEEDGREVKQQSELKKLDAGTKHVPNILHREAVMDSKVPGGRVTDVPSVCVFNKSKIGFGFVVISRFSRVGLGVVSSRPTHALRAHLNVLPLTVLVAGVPDGGGAFFLLGTPLLARSFLGSGHSRDQCPGFPQSWHVPCLGPPPSCFVRAKISA